MIERSSKKTVHYNCDYLYHLFEARLEGKIFTPQPLSPRDFVNHLENGVSGKVLRTMIKHIPKSVVAKTIGCDTTHCSKLIRKKHLNSKQTEQLNELTTFWSELLLFFDSDNELVIEWIEQPIPVLDGASPKDLMWSQYGRVEVRKILDRMRFADFA